MKPPEVETNNINTSGDTGGNINLQANQAVIAAEINARGLVNDGGDVTIDPEELVVTSIDAQGGAFGFGGNVDLTSTGFFRATDGFIDDSGTFSSIATLGGLGSGSITIRHDGGDRFEPFIVGDPTINGTAGALNTGDFIIAPFQVFPGSFFLGNISIITSDRFANALDQAVSTKIPELQPEAQPKEKGFFIDEYFTRTFERFFADNELAAEQRIKSLSEIRNELADIEKTTGVKPTLVYGLFQPQSVVAGCKATGEVTEKLEDSPNNLLSNENMVRANPSGEMTENEDESCLVNPSKLEKTEEDILTLVTVTSDGAVGISIVEGATRNKVEDVSRDFREFLNYRDSTDWNFNSDFRETSKQLYKWLVTPLELADDEDSNNGKIPNLTFILDDFLRSVPLAAIGKDKLPSDCVQSESCLLNYLIEDYSIGLMPSMSLTETEYRDVTQLDLRISGAKEIEGEDDLLNSVEIEIEKIQEIWSSIPQDVDSSDVLQNENFTIENLKKAQRKSPFGIVHLATHANFTDKEKSYIAFNPEPNEMDSSGKLKIDHVRTMYWDDVSLLILDACETAIGNQDAELGFAGFAHRAQTNTVLGTLWKVEDYTTSTFMARLYQTFAQHTANGETQPELPPIKAEIIRQVQKEMLYGRLTIEDVYALYKDDNTQMQTLLDFSELPTEEEELDLSNPHFWSTFTLVGSPW